MIETLEPEVQTERLLVFEVKEGIDSLKNLAENNASTLNEIHRLSPELKTQSEILSVSGKSAKAYVMRLFFDRNPKARELSSFAETKFIIGPELESLQRLLENMHERTFSMVSFDKKSKQWQIDDEAFQAACMRYRRYASTPEEISRYKFLVAHFEYITRELKPGPHALKKFYGPLIQNTMSGGLQPNWSFVWEPFRY